MRVNVPKHCAMASMFAVAQPDGKAESADVAPSSCALRVRQHDNMFTPGRDPR